MASVPVTPAMGRFIWTRDPCLRLSNDPLQFLGPNNPLVLLKIQAPVAIMVSKALGGP